MLKTTLRDSKGLRKQYEGKGLVYTGKVCYDNGRPQFETNRYSAIEQNISRRPEWIYAEQ